MPMVSEVTTRLGRVQLITGTPPMAPGHCVICGTPGNSESQFIDTGWDVDFYGVVYFCMNCIREAAAVLSMVSLEKYTKLYEDYDAEKYQREALQDENERLRNVINDLRSFGFSTDSNQSHSDSSKSTMDETAESPEPIGRKLATAKSRSTKQTNVSGSTNVRLNDSSKESTPGINI